MYIANVGNSVCKIKECIPGSFKKAQSLFFALKSDHSITCTMDHFFVAFVWFSVHLTL